MRRRHRIQRWTSALLCAGLIASAVAPALAAPQERVEDERGERHEASREQREALRAAHRAEAAAAHGARHEHPREPMPPLQEHPARQAAQERGPRPERQAAEIEYSGEEMRRQQARRESRQGEEMIHRLAEQRAGEERRAQERAFAELDAAQRAAREQSDQAHAATVQDDQRRMPEHRGSEHVGVRGARTHGDDSRERRPHAEHPEARLAGQRDRGDSGEWRDRRGEERHQRRISRDEQHRLIEHQRLQANQWQRTEAARRAHIERHARELERQRRSAQYRYQREYYRRWLAQQARWSSWNDYYNDPYYTTASNYRYGFGGQWYSTNRYGADLLRQAVRDGYQEGFYAGRADRMDGWRFDYRNAYAWMDGSYGYHGRYVSQAAYRHYFRQGFERGYRDAYYGRSQFGYYDGRNNLAVILPVVLSAILGFQNY